jgi:hypothetical protein
MIRKLIFSLLLGTVLLCQAEASNPPIKHHQWRVGWGDMLFETLAFFEGAARNDDFLRTDRYGYTGHFFVEYQYRFNKVVSVGIQTDIEGIFWNETPCDARRNPIGATVRSRNYDLSFLPTVRLTFLNTRYVQLYGGAGTGLLVAFDNARQCELAPVINLTPLGVQVGKGHWSGSVEFGGMISLLNANKIYMLGSRLVSVSLNYSW